MTVHKARIKSCSLPRRSAQSPQGVRKPRGCNPVHLPDRRPSATASDIHHRMVKFLPRLRRFTSSLTNGAAFSEDLVQETYVRALAHLDQWQPGSRLDSWMFRIARNLWIDHLRTEKFRGEAIDIDAVGHLLSQDGQILAENRILLDELRREIAALSTDQRDVINLVWLCGLTYRETGRILNLPAGTVMSRLARARGALQKFG